MANERATPTVGNKLRRDFDLVVFGATGLTGRLVMEQLVGVDHLLTESDGVRRWAVAGRDRGRVGKVLSDLKVEDVEIIVADLDDRQSLEALARKATVVVNLAGPYTGKAQNLIAACVEAGASYVDLSGEIPLLRRTIDRFDGPARKANVQVVQMAGWEAMPADLAALVACKRAVGGGSGDDGPGAAEPIASVTVSIRFKRMPEGGVPFNQSVSAGTLASIVEMLDDPEAALVGRPDALLPAGAVKPGGPRPAAMRFGVGPVDGRVLGPVVPVAFLNPPIIHRTAALLAAERGASYRPAAYTEGVDMGESDGSGALRRQFKAQLKGGLQRVAVGMTRLPLVVRRTVAGQVRRILPEAGTGPTGPYLRDWEWAVTARAVGSNGVVGNATIEGTGHPGYTATAAIIVEVALSMASHDGGSHRSGCITPALAIGAEPGNLRVASLNLR